MADGTAKLQEEVPLSALLADVTLGRVPVAVVAVPEAFRVAMLREAVEEEEAGIVVDGPDKSKLACDGLDPIVTPPPMPCPLTSSIIEERAEGRGEAGLEFGALEAGVASAECVGDELVDMGIVMLGTDRVVEDEPMVEEPEEREGDAKSLDVGSGV